MSTSDDILAKAQKSKASTVVNGYEYFGLGSTEKGDLDLDKVWLLFEEKGFNLIVNTVNNGIDSKSANIDLKQYAAIQQIMYDMTCQTENHSEDMYYKVKILLEKYVTENVQPALESVTGLRLLQEFRSRWHNHLFMSCWMRRFFGMLDTACVVNKGLVYTASMTLRTFFSHAYKTQRLNIINALLEEITKFRDGEEADMNLIADTAVTLQHLGAVSTKNQIHRVVADNKEFKSGTWKSAPALVKQTVSHSTKSCFRSCRLTFYVLFLMLFLFLFSSCCLLVLFLFSSLALFLFFSLALFLLSSCYLLAIFLLSSCSLLALFLFSLLSNGQRYVLKSMNTVI